MSSFSVSFVTISCDQCDKNATFAQTQEDEKEAVVKNPWLDTVRIVQTRDKRQFLYCSDECEIKATSKGTHNKQEQKKIVPGNASQIDLAARAEHIARQATQAMKAGSGIEVHQ